jgi:hypothetical protein
VDGKEQAVPGQAEAIAKYNLVEIRKGKKMPKYSTPGEAQAVGCLSKPCDGFSKVEL